MKKQKYIMLEFGEFSCLYRKCSDILQTRVQTKGPDELCLLLETLCNKFKPEGATSTSWKRIPMVPPEILSKISREELEELIEVDYKIPPPNMYEHSVTTDWDNVLDGLVTRLEDQEER